MLVKRPGGIYLQSPTMMLEEDQKLYAEMPIAACLGSPLRHLTETFFPLYNFSAGNRHSLVKSQGSTDQAADKIYP